MRSMRGALWGSVRTKILISRRRSRLARTPTSTKRSEAKEWLIFTHTNDIVAVNEALIAAIKRPELHTIVLANKEFVNQHVIAAKPELRYSQGGESLEPFFVEAYPVHMPGARSLASPLVLHLGGGYADLCGSTTLAQVLHESMRMQTPMRTIIYHRALSYDDDDTSCEASHLVDVLRRNTNGTTAGLVEIAQQAWPTHSESLSDEESEVYAYWKWNPPGTVHNQSIEIIVTE